MTTIEVEYDNVKEYSDGDVEEHDDVKEDVKEIVKEEVIKEEIINKPVKQLSKSERQKLIDEFENGVDNTYYKCHRLKNGSVRITKRANPLVTDVDKVHEVTRNRINNKVNTQRLTDNQLLMEHIIDLEKRYEVMRMKHKKLKKRYNKLETDLFEDDSDDELNVREVVVNDGVENSVETSEIHEKTVENAVQEPVEHRKNIVQEPVEPVFRTVKRPVKKQTWRSIITSF